MAQDPKTKTVKTPSGRDFTYETNKQIEEADRATEKAQKRYFSDSPNAGANLQESMKNVVKDSMVRSHKVRMENKANYEKTKSKK